MNQLGEVLADLHPDFAALFVDVPVADADPGVGDELAALVQKWRVAAGQRWKIASVTMPGVHHWLMCGDSTSAADVGRLFAAGAPVMMVTDPPYGVEYDPSWRLKYDNQWRTAIGTVQNDDRVDWSAAYELFTGDVVYIWHASLYGGEVLAHLEANRFQVRSQIIWAKQHFVFGRGHYHWQHEPCFYGVRKGKTAQWAGDRTQSTVWDIANNNPFGNSDHELQTGHGTQKPVECMARPIRNHFQQGVVVYDPFCGSGTTLVACEQERRIGLGMEIDPGYVAATLERLAGMGLVPELVDTKDIVVTER